jgi:diaminopimelate decarboxylase
LGPENLLIVKMPYQKIIAAQPGFQFFIFTGATCHESDQLGIFRVAQNGSVPPVAPIDPILLSNINGYSFAWNTEFNGVPKARVRFV